MSETVKRGGGVLCYCTDDDGSLHFLIQAMGEGSRKKGHLVDLGGGCEGDETPAEAAIRESYEEGLQFLYPTLGEWRAVFRASNFAVKRRKKGTEWLLFVVKVEPFDLANLNASVDRTRKSRSFQWISAESLLVAYQTTKKDFDASPSPGDTTLRVWKRLAQMPLPEIVTTMVKIAALQHRIARLGAKEV